MIMQSGRFSGGSGGSNRDVVFTARVVADPKNAQVLAGIAKQVDDLQKKMGGLRLGTDGGSVVGGRAVAGGGVAGGRRRVAMDPYEEYNRMRDQELREQRDYRRRMERDRQRTEARLAAAEFNAIDRENAAFDRRGGRAGMNQRFSARVRLLRGEPEYGVTRGQFGEALEGITGLARAAVFLGASSEKSAQQMLKSILVFEAMAQATRGAMKVSEPLGALLGAGAGRLGMGAGASAGWLGAAGLAAGVGIIGGGTALFDQARYSSGGGIGGFSQAHANFFTGMARRGLNNGIDLSGRFGQVAGAVNPLLGIFNASGYTRAVTERARGDIAYERGAMSRATDTGGMLEYSNRRLENERQVLALMERQVAKARETMEVSTQRLQGIANNYQSLSPFDQARAGQLRDKFLKDPRSLNSQQLNALRPLLGEAENQQIDALMMERSGRFFGGGGASREQRATSLQNAIPTLLMQSATELQRTFTIQLERQNEEAERTYATALEAALKVANDDMQERLEAQTKRIIEAQRAAQRSTLQKLQDMERSYGTP